MREILHTVATPGHVNARADIRCIVGPAHHLPLAQVFLGSATQHTVDAPQLLPVNTTEGEDE